MYLKVDSVDASFAAVLIVCPHEEIQHSTRVLPHAAKLAVAAFQQLEAEPTAQARVTCVL